VVQLSRGVPVYQSLAGDRLIPFPASISAQGSGFEGLSGRIATLGVASRAGPESLTARTRPFLRPHDGNEYGPLLKTPRAFVVYARRGTYAEDAPTPASGFDHQKGYIDFWLKFIGVKEVHTLVVEGRNKVGGRFLGVVALIAPEFSTPWR
jgi:Flavodoxin-like fold